MKKCFKDGSQSRNIAENAHDNSWTAIICIILQEMTNLFSALSFRHQLLIIKDKSIFTTGRAHYGQMIWLDCFSVIDDPLHKLESLRAN